MPVCLYLCNCQFLYLSSYLPRTLDFLNGAVGASIFHRKHLSRHLLVQTLHVATVDVDLWEE